MNQSFVQTDLFGNQTRVAPEAESLKFCVKMQFAENAGLRYELRIQIPDKTGNNKDSAMAKCFVIKNGLSQNPHHKPLAFLVDDHKLSGFRREGTILRGPGMGALIQFDEGYFTLAQGKKTADQEEEFYKGLHAGKMVLHFHGRKMQGEFHFYKKGTGRYAQWIIQKAPDSYATERDILKQNRSVLSGYTIQHYIDQYYKQKQMIYKLDPDELNSYLRKNEAESFKFKDMVLAL